MSNVPPGILTTKHQACIRLRTRRKYTRLARVF